MKTFSIIGLLLVWSIMMYMAGAVNTDASLMKENKSLHAENDSLHSYIKRNQLVYKIGYNQLMKGK